MIVELTVCLAVLIATVVLFFLAVQWCRSRRWLRLTFVLICIVILHLIAANLVGPAMRGYLYRTADPEVTFLECPFKGVPYESMLVRYREAGNSGELFRTFDKDWWNFYRWYDYSIHPRWRLAFRPDERQKA
jgi:hypothetical protein